LSLSQPEYVLTKLEEKSAKPSIKPNTSAEPCNSIVKNCARIEVAISWLASLNRLVKPIAATFLFSHLPPF
jgi:hypothetical protein